MVLTERAIICGSCRLLKRIRQEAKAIFHEAKHMLPGFKHTAGVSDTATNTLYDEVTIVFYACYGIFDGLL